MSGNRSIRLACAVLALGILAAACSKSESKATSTTAAGGPAAAPT